VCGSKDRENSIQWGKVEDSRVKCDLLRKNLHLVVGKVGPAVHYSGEMRIKV